MEVLPTSGAPHDGESKCTQQTLGSSVAYEDKPMFTESAKQVRSSATMDELLMNPEQVPVEDHHDDESKLMYVESAKQVQSSSSTMDELLISPEQVPTDHREDEDRHRQAEESLSPSSRDSETVEINMLDHETPPCLTSSLVVDTIESESPSNSKIEESSFTEPKWLEPDEPIPLWVKWRGIYQVAIKCARADWPLATLRAKPTHDRKKYFVVFFPQKKNYSWADMQLVRSIYEFPMPIAYRSHKTGLKLVKDLTVARRYIMQKLAVGMLNIVDQIRLEALVETARDVKVWKEFALEASRCFGYDDLGRMLLKLQSMILQHYVNSDWLENSADLWKQKCHDVQSAERIELLKEELFDSIGWNEVSSLSHIALQPTLGSEWKTWKHDVMKMFSTMHTGSNVGETKGSGGDIANPDVQVNRKRAKLEIRRPEAHVSPNETDQTATAIATDLEFFNARDTISSIELQKDNCFGDENSRNDLPKSAVVEAGRSEIMQTKDLSATPAKQLVPKERIDSGSRNRQCMAFIESKGRHCVRWANEGDVYCCVHLASRFTANSARTDKTPPVETPMCGGITVLGTKCKHRSLPGSLFCKKHRPHNNSGNTMHSPEHTVKRKTDAMVSCPESTSCRDTASVDRARSSLQVNYHSIPSENPGCSLNGAETGDCIGSYSQNYHHPCYETPKHHTLYCDKHLPSWLKRARNGKSRIISKEVFLGLLKTCSSHEQKLHLHKACELFYKVFKSILSLRNPVPVEVQLEWALSEASKDFDVGELLMRLVHREKERLIRIWGFSADRNAHVSPMSVEPNAQPLAFASDHNGEEVFGCKICSMRLNDDQDIGTHWAENHKDEMQRVLRGYACAICLDSFNEKGVLESHVQERHHVQFVDKCMLLQCTSCCSHFGNGEELWSHVSSAHPSELRSRVQLQNLEAAPAASEKPKLDKSASAVSRSDNVADYKFVCKLCGLKFALLPDLGRHHQAAHMGVEIPGSRPPKRGVRYYAYRLKSGRLSRPRFKKGLGAVSYRIRNRATENIKRRIQASKSLTADEGIPGLSSVVETETLGALTEFQCAKVANELFSKVIKTKPRPSNLDILAVARSACCKLSLKASLEAKFGIQPERMYLKAAKLCSEHNIQVQWHQENFLCPNGCKYFKDPSLLPPLVPRQDEKCQQRLYSEDSMHHDWEVDECHCIIESYHLRDKPQEKTFLLCKDISFGRESVPVACVVAEGLRDSLQSPAISDEQHGNRSMPWESFTYITKPMLEQQRYPTGLQSGCACPTPSCSPRACDHVYLFDNDFVDARDIYGKPMRCRFPYDEKRRIILEDGYLVYECNRMCCCSQACPNRVLQNGVQVKLEVFKTEDKGWAMRAREPILRGTFICELLGEVLDEEEAKKRHARYGRGSCGYMFKVDAQINDMSRFLEGEPCYVIDATSYGNVSRFINHCCTPNLTTYQVLIESMESHRAHIGLYTNRDIAAGEELTSRYELFAGGEGHPCLCGSSDCRGGLY